MDTQVMRKTSQPKLSQSTILANQALTEKSETGRVDVVCPKCGQHPTIVEGGNRCTVKCPCGFINYGEIYF